MWGRKQTLLLSWYIKENDGNNRNKSLGAEEKMRNEDLMMNGAGGSKGGKEGRR